MALVKKYSQTSYEPEAVAFDTLDDAIDYFYKQDGSFDAQSYSIEKIVEFEGGAEALVKMLVDNPYTSKEITSKIASTLENLDPAKAPIESIMELLKVKNAYVRNFGITVLQSYGDAIRYYIVKFLIGDNRDLRIFAINVLGDVKFAESRDMLVELLAKEQDINVAMTAVDYMAEIGQVEDIELLSSLKSRFNDVFVDFAIDNAIKMIRG